MRTSADHATSTSNSVRFTIVLGSFILVTGFGCTHQNAASPGHLTHLWGQLLDSGGRPVSQYPMKLEPVGGSSPGFSAVTNYGGDFEFADVPKGTYRVYAANRPRELSKVVEVRGSPTEFAGQILFGESINVDLNAAAAPVINDQAKQTINSDAARTINPDAARTINPDAARVINPAAARAINPAAARVLNPERAKVLTPEQARTITVEQAQEPVRAK